jgi:hypothetical protein
MHAYASNVIDIKYNHVPDFDGLAEKVSDSMHTNPHRPRATPTDVCYESDTYSAKSLKSGMWFYISSQLKSD